MRIDCNNVASAVPVVAVAGPDRGARAAWAGAFARHVGGVLLEAARWRDDADALPRTARLLGAVADRPLLVLDVDEEHSLLDVIGECADPAVPVVLYATVTVLTMPEVRPALRRADDRARILLDALEACTHRVHLGEDPEAVRVVEALQPTARVVPGDPARWPAASATASPASGGSARRRAQDVLGPLAPVGPERDEAGWLRLLNDEWPADAHRAHGRSVTVFRHDHHRPLHAGRWEDLALRWGARAGTGGGVRVAGLCRVSSQPSWTCRWDQLGEDVALHPLMDDDDVVAAPPAEPGLVGEAAEEDEDTGLLCPGHDLAVFAWGADWDEEMMRAELAAAALTDQEFLSGPAAW